jgi:hypothetical protein
MRITILIRKTIEVTMTIRITIGISIIIKNNDPHGHAGYLPRRRDATDRQT